MEIDVELLEMAAMFGGDQSFSDRGLIAMLCPHLEGKMMQELTPSEFQELLAAAQAIFPADLDDLEDD
jgi:hypothetical protein